MLIFPIALWLAAAAVTPQAPMPPCRAGYVVALDNRTTGFQTIARYCAAETTPRWVSDEVAEAAIFGLDPSGNVVAGLQSDIRAVDGVTVLDAATGRVRAHLATNACPGTAALTATHLFLSPAFNTGCPQNDGTLHVYTPPSAATFTKIALHTPADGIAFDRQGALTVLEDAGIETFDATTLRKLREYTGKNVVWPQAVAFAADDRMIVANAWFEQCDGAAAPGFVSVFKPGATALEQRIDGIGCPVSLALAGATLYVADAAHGRVLLYAWPGLHLVRQITAGIETPAELAVDAAGTLYVVNAEWALHRSAHPGIAVYPKGASTPSSVLQFDGRTPFDLHVLP
jgi:hypothetical protein